MTNWDLYREVAALPGGRPEGIFGDTIDPDWRLLRDYPPRHEDGGHARVWATRLPAQFFRLTAGDVEITTGSGIEMGELMIALAEAVSEGMVSFRTAPDGGARA